MENSKAVGKYVIVRDLSFGEYMKDKEGNIKIYDSMDEAASVCGMYEFPDALVLKVEYNHVEPQR